MNSVIMNTVNRYVHHALIPINLMCTSVFENLLEVTD